MLVVTNPGSNVPAALAEHYSLQLLPQKIVVDGTMHDTREGLSHAQIDEWVAGAKEHPFVLGTSAAEFVSHFLRIGERDRELLLVTSSRKIIQSHDAAVVAARTLAEHPRGREFSVRIVDSKMTDTGALLVTMFAAEAAVAGHDLQSTFELTSRFASRGEFAFVPQTFDYLIKGGRATFLRAWAAKMLGIRPIIAFNDGELGVVGRISKREDRVDAIVSWIKQRVAAKRVWVGVTHGGVPEEAQRVLRGLEGAYEVEWGTVLPLSPSIYLHGGPKAIGVAVVPAEKQGWSPPGL